MASVWIQKREGLRGTSYHVKWEGPSIERADGKIRSKMHIGSFKTEREAKARANWARDEWAHGRVPDPKMILLRAQSSAPRVSVVAKEWLASRIDLAPSSISQYQSRVDHIAASDIGDLRTDEVKPSDVRAWMGEVSDFKPSTISVLVHVLRMVLDYADVSPNPARDRSVKMPRGYTKNQRIRLPTSVQVAAIREGVGVEFKPLLDFLEDTGARIAEACALDWKDVHADRVLIRGTKRDTALRWAYNATSPIRLLAEPRGSGRVFSVSPSQVRYAMQEAIPDRFSPHDYRHLHASRLLHGGASPAVVSERLGHALPTLLASYAHVLPPD